MGSAEIKIRQKLERVLADAADDVELRLAQWLEAPADVEAMHKFRVSVRTLRGLADFVKPFQKGKQNRRMQRDLRDVVRQTSRLRELDVLAEQATMIDAEPAPDLLEACARMRTKECRRVIEALTGEACEAKLARARRDARLIEWKGDAAFGVSRDEVLVRFDDLVYAEGERMETLDRADAERTHEVRKQAKQVRYAAVRFKSLLREDAAEVAAHMEGIQDELGALCDARVNLELIDNFPRKGLSAAALANLEDMRTLNIALVDAALAGRSLGR